MKKLLLSFVCGLLVLVSFTTIASGDAETIETLKFPIKYNINGHISIPEGEYDSLYYNGHVYAPIRFIAENMFALVDYNDVEGTRTITIKSMPDMNIGPSVTPDQAKIVAYEMYHFRHIEDDVSIRSLTREEYKHVPLEAVGLTPVYYFVNGLDANDEEETICLSSNNKDHYFVYDKENSGTADTGVREGVDNNPPDLGEIGNTIARSIPEMKQKNSIIISSISTNKNDEIEMVFRKTGDFKTQLTGQELDEIRQSIFHIVGTEFPLILSQYYIKEADITGFVREIDQSKNRVLIVDDTKKVGQTEYSEAIWVTLSSDARIVSGPREEPKTFGDLRVGQEVKSWFFGPMFDSYPSQTETVKIEILPAYHN